MICVKTICTDNCKYKYLYNLKNKRKWLLYQCIMCSSFFPFFLFVFLVNIWIQRRSHWHWQWSLVQSAVWTQSSDLPLGQSAWASAHSLFFFLATYPQNAERVFLCKPRATWHEVSLYLLQEKSRVNDLCERVSLELCYFLFIEDAVQTHVQTSPSLFLSKSCVRE